MNTTLEKKTKRKKLSKNKKKSWRKVNISEIEEFLEDEALQKRTGGLAREKKNEELFFIDKKPGDSNAELKPSKRNANKPLKCFSGLLPDHQAAQIKRSQKKTNKTSKVKTAKTTVKSVPVKRKVNRQRNSKDIWNDAEDGNNDMNSPDEHFLKVTRTKRVKTPKTYHKKPSEIEAITAPHPGASYNPTFEDHQELLKRATEIEKKKLKEQQKIYNSLNAKFPKTPISEEEYLKEMSGGIIDNEDAEDDSGDESDDVQVTHRATISREDKKTEKQRKKEKARKLQEKVQKLEKIKKIKNHDIYRLKQIKEELHQHKMASVMRKRLKAKMSESKKNRTKKLGSIKYEEPSVELKLSNELESNLRRLKPEGDLLKDRYNSFCKRNIIEPRKRIKKFSKYKPKYFEKKGHKELS
ncbi:DgyrCDS11699 [Dimorphilus gyrociliatus]|uniref:Ribosome biogenesis protein NOP53 n=1 Tax=Dimorphilus gyrociliatus TaxID=2664684 RepID=A0A7I8W4B7_9ANNE|nr:DgyrCDS11699 [Dimorphilus gyrociliatus]